MVRRRGVSDVVITVLIVLIGLAAVALLWSFLQPALKKAGSQISGACLELNLEPVNCLYNANASTASVRVKRGADDVKLKKLKLVFEMNEQKDTQVVNSDSYPGLLETISVNNVSVKAKPLKVGVAGLIDTEFGEEKLCEEGMIKVKCE